MAGGARRLLGRLLGIVQPKGEGWLGGTFRVLVLWSQTLATKWITAWLWVTVWWWVSVWWWVTVWWWVAVWQLGLSLLFPNYSMTIIPKFYNHYSHLLCLLFSTHTSRHDHETTKEKYVHDLYINVHYTVTLVQFQCNQGEWSLRFLQLLWDD